jgi:hypothetical protein
MDTMPATSTPTRHHQRTRRINSRANVSWTVWARIRGERVRFHTVDVSTRGAKLRAKGNLQPGAALTLHFMKPTGRVRVSAMVWRVDADGLGVLFLGAPPADLFR